jgi:hypothetical protein
MGRRVGFESWVERSHLVALDFEPAVTAIVSQPFWLSWRTPAGKVRRHPPDFFARLADGGGLVIDSRPAGVADDKDLEAFAATRRACELLGWGYMRRELCRRWRPAYSGKCDVPAGTRRAPVMPGIRLVRP